METVAGVVAILDSVKNILIALAVLLLVALAFFVFYRKRGLQRHSRLLGAQLHDIGELVVEEMCCSVVHCTKEPRTFFGKDLPWNREQLILVVDVRIKVGFDFDAIRVDVNDRLKKIVLHLPEMQVSSNEILFETMEIFDEKTGVFARQTANVNRENHQHLKAKALEMVERWGIYDRAKESAQKRLEKFVGKLYDLNRYQLIIVYADQSQSESNPMMAELNEQSA